MKIATRNILILFILAVGFIFISAKMEYNPTVSFYTPTGKINRPTRVWDGIITPTTGSGQTIDISSAGFTSINSVTVTPGNNSTAAADMPLAVVKSYTNSQVTINILSSNSTVVGALGSTVAGLMIATSLTGMSVHVRVDGW